MIYTYKCDTCGERTEAHRPMRDRYDAPACHCGQPTRLLITGGQKPLPVYGGHDFPGYHCPVTDTWVDSRRQRREIMARHDLVEKG